MSTDPGALARRLPESGVHNTSPGAGADPPLSRLRLASSSRSGGVLIALFSSMTTMTIPALAAPGPETFGPGKVACERLGADRFDCLLTSLRVSENGNDVATFSLASLPPTERAIFQKWCSTAADDCTVQIQGARPAPLGSRLPAVTSVRWIRLKSPRNQAAARASGD